MIRHLDAYSALARLDSPWPLTTHLAVRTLEEINTLWHVTLLAAGVKSDKLPEPLHIPRPGERREVSDKPPEAAQRPHRGQSGVDKRLWVHQLIAAAGEGLEVVG